MKSKIAAIALVFILPFTAYAFSSGDTGDSKAINDLSTPNNTVDSPIYFLIRNNVFKNCRIVHYQYIRIIILNEQLN